MINTICYYVESEILFNFNVLNISCRSDSDSIQATWGVAS